MADDRENDTGNPTKLADEVAQRVLEVLQPRLDQMTGEIRAAKRDLGQEIDAINARLTADKASTDELLAGMRQDLSRHSTVTKSVLDSHSSRLRAIDGKIDVIGDHLRAIADRLDRAHVPAE